MFRRCKSLTSIDLSALGASDVKDMDSVFSECTSLERVDLSGLEGSSPKEMNELFSACSSIKELDLTALDSSQAKTLNYLFYNCPQLKRVDLSSFDTSGAVQMEDMFGGCARAQGSPPWKGPSRPAGSVRSLCACFRACAGTRHRTWRSSSGRQLYAASEIPANQSGTYRSGILLDTGLIDLFSRYYVYDGAPVSLILTTSLTEGVDYTATYADNVNVGTGSVTFQGIGDYTGQPYL